MHTIATLSAREILDSRGIPTLEVSCSLEGGGIGTAAVPSGASTGTREAVELRDGDLHRYGGKGVRRAVEGVLGEIAKRVCGSAYSQRSLDRTLIDLDGSVGKSRLGGNTILGVSLAFARAAANAQGVALYEHVAAIAETVPRLPIPAFNIINGGKHADSGLAIQECMVIPQGIGSVAEQVRAASEITTALRTILHNDGYAVSVGDEGGFAPSLPSDEVSLEYIQRAVVSAGYDNASVMLGMDAAASSFFDGERYRISIGGSDHVTSDELIEWYTTLKTKYNIISIEDGLAEHDFEGFARLSARLGDHTLIVGDDLTVTSVDRIEEAARHNSINCVIIKPNQIGTLCETIDAVLLAKRYGWKTFASHRSGETVDTAIADIAVGLACEYLKAGAPVRGERVAKYNRLMEIEEEMKRHGKGA